mmetsp:Transcript_3947/g.11340  ORF Transcript_3947/g.11340 Transcript_3947/m.11340 type:complete len:549 (-) Transcript_3947:343-1989(-)
MNYLYYVFSTLNLQERKCSLLHDPDGLEPRDLLSCELAHAPERSLVCEPCRQVVVEVVGALPWNMDVTVLLPVGRELGEHSRPRAPLLPRESHHVQQSLVLKGQVVPVLPHVHHPRVKPVLLLHVAVPVNRPELEQRLEIHLPLEALPLDSQLLELLPLGRGEHARLPESKVNLHPPCQLPRLIKLHFSRSAVLRHHQVVVEPHQQAEHRVRLVVTLERSDHPRDFPELALVRVEAKARFPKHGLPLGQDVVVVPQNLLLLPPELPPGHRLHRKLHRAGLRAAASVVLVKPQPPGDVPGLPVKVDRLQPLHVVWSEPSRGIGDPLQLRPLVKRQLPLVHVHGHDLRVAILENEVQKLVEHGLPLSGDPETKVEPNGREEVDLVRRQFPERLVPPQRLGPPLEFARHLFASLLQEPARRQLDGSPVPLVLHVAKDEKRHFRDEGSDSFPLNLAVLDHVGHESLDPSQRLGSPSPVHQNKPPLGDPPSHGGRNNWRDVLLRHPQAKQRFLELQVLGLGLPVLSRRGVRIRPLLHDKRREYCFAPPLTAPL